jgi:hypothetical protein
MVVVGGGRTPDSYGVVYGTKKWPKTSYCDSFPYNQIIIPKPKEVAKTKIMIMGYSKCSAIFPC